MFLRGFHGITPTTGALGLLWRRYSGICSNLCISFTPRWQLKFQYVSPGQFQSLTMVFPFRLAMQDVYATDDKDACESVIRHCVGEENLAQGIDSLWDHKNNFAVEAGTQFPSFTCIFLCGLDCLMSGDQPRFLLLQFIRHVVCRRCPNRAKGVHERFVQCRGRVIHDLCHCQGHDWREHV